MLRSVVVVLRLLYSLFTRSLSQNLLQINTLVFHFRVLVFFVFFVALALRGSSASFIGLCAFIYFGRVGFQAYV